MERALGPLMADVRAERVQDGRERNGKKRGGDEQCEPGSRRQRNEQHPAIVGAAVPVPYLFSLFSDSCVFATW